MKIMQKLEHNFINRFVLSPVKTETIIAKVEIIREITFLFGYLPL